MSDFVQALSQSGLVASQFGLSIEDTIGTLTGFADAGLLGSDAGTSFRNMLLRLANPAGEAASQLQDLGIYAYDAQGQFVGITDLSGQLQTQLAGLTDQQRQSALATIFGTDSIRAASIMYEQGASGMQAYIDATNDSGYAQEVASERLNSLSGDMQKLWGVLGEVAIAAGEASNGPLRDLVQQLTDILRVAAQNPEVLQVVAIGIGAIGTALLTMGTIMKVATMVSEFRTAITKLGTTSKTAAIGMDAAEVSAGRLSTTLGVLGKAVGIALAAFAAIELIEALKKEMTYQVEVGDELAGTFQRIAEGKLDMDAAFQNEIGGAMRGGGLSLSQGWISDLDNMDSAIKGFLSRVDYFDQETGKLFGLIETGATDSVRHMQTLAEQMAETGLTDSNIEFFTTVEARMRELGGTSEDVADAFKAQFEKTRNELIDASGEWMSYSTDVETVLRVMGGQLPQGLTIVEGKLMHVSQAAEAAAGGMDGASTGAATLEQEQQAAADAADEHVKSLQALNDMLYGLANASLSAEATQDAFEAALAKTSEVVEDNGKKIGENSEEGRALNAQLRDIATSANSATQAMVDNGDSVENTTAFIERAREEYVKGARSMGDMRDEAVIMAEAVDRIPTNVAVQYVNENMGLTMDEVITLNSHLEGLPEEERIAIVTEADRSGYNEAMEMVRQINAAKALIRIQTQVVGGVSTPVMGRMEKKADGGRIHGMGGPREDKQPILASPGEFMIREAVARDKYPALEHLNRTGQWPAGYADGGRITASPAPIARPVSTSSTVSYGDTITTYHLEGREAYQALDNHLRDSGRVEYQTKGVH